MNFKCFLHKIIQQMWYKKFKFYHFHMYPLIVFSAIYYLIIKFKPHPPQNKTKNVIIIVIGNFTTGGSGKTTLITWIAKELMKLNLKIAIITRGYKGKPPCATYFVNKKSTHIEAGDEAIMLFNNLNIPVVIDKN